MSRDLIERAVKASEAIRSGILKGQTQIFRKSITSAANAGLVTVATVTAQPCLIKRVVLKAVTASQVDLLTAAIVGGAAQAVIFIDVAVAIVASLNSIDDQVSGVGAWELAATKLIQIDLQGGGATAVDLLVTIEYESCTDGGYLV